MPSYIQMTNISWSKLALAMFLLTILLPQGVGIEHPWGLPNIDLPRIAAILLFMMFFAYLMIHRPHPAKLFSAAPGTQLLLVVVIAILFLSALFSESPNASLLWAAGDTIQVFGLAFVVIFFAGLGEHSKSDIMWAIIIVGSVLALCAAVELLIQGPLIKIRNCWDPDVWNLFSHLKRFFHIPNGPYGNGQNLVAALCLFGGNMLLGREQRPVYLQLMLGTLIVIAILGMQSIAGLVACLVMIAIAFELSTGVIRWWPVILLAAITGIVLLFFSVSSTHGNHLFWEQMIDYIIEGRGSLPYRLYSDIGLFQNLFAHQWLLGFGPGSLTDMARVHTPVYHGGWETRTDPGSFFMS